MMGKAQPDAEKQSHTSKPQSLALTSITEVTEEKKQTDVGKPVKGSLLQRFGKLLS